MTKQQWATLARFYQKQLEDRSGIISRSADLDPNNPLWLVQEIEQKLATALSNANNN